MTVRVRQTKIADDLYWIDVQVNGEWHYLQIPHTLKRVKAYRRFMAKENAR